MHTAKEEVRKLLDQLPADTSLEEIQYHIYVKEKILRGLQDVKEDRLIDEKEAEKRMSRWIAE